jgi:predicted acetyltransferase
MLPEIRAEDKIGSVIHLMRPGIGLAQSYLDFIEEERRLGERIWDGLIPCLEETVPTFIERLHREETHPEQGRVPETTYWGVMNGQVVGRIALRHFLNRNLEEFGGHIGYEVRPSVRGRGVAKAMLAAVLATPKAKEIGRILLTCAPDNIASNRTILGNGGVLGRTAYVEKWQRMTNYYWIDLRQP